MSKPAVITASPAWFFREVAAARKRVLVVDYDGTIAPFTANRRKAFPYPDVPPLLTQIMQSCGTRVILVSGRAAHGVAPLLGLDPAPETWGTYGLERLYADGRYEGPEVSDEALDALSQAEESLEGQGLDKCLEISPGSVAVHWRGLQPSEILDVRTKAYRVLNPLAVNAGLLVSDFDGGLEIRLRSANTGDAVRSILNEIDGDVPIAYLGDDTSDEDAFRVLNGRGLTVLVRPMYRFTAAQLWLQPPDDLIGFLHEWVRAAGGEV
jgi:trehalose-phosphatase